MHIVGTQIMVCPVIVIVGMYRLFNAYAILLVAVGIGAFLKKNTVKERGVPLNAETGTDGKDPPGTGGCRVDGKLRAACPPRQRKGGDYRQKCGCGYLV